MHWAAVDSAGGTSDRPLPNRSSSHQDFHWTWQNPDVEVVHGDDGGSMVAEDEKEAVGNSWNSQSPATDATRYTDTDVAWAVAEVADFLSHCRLLLLLILVERW